MVEEEVPMAVYVNAESRTGYDRRYEDKVFAPGTRCIEMVDYIGVGGERDDSGEMISDGGPGQSYGVRYCRAESFYRCFARAKFGGPCIVNIGEYPAEAYDKNGYAITDVRINMAAAFRDSDLQILPRGCSREIIGNVNSMFENCTQLRNWTPTEMVAAGIAGVSDRNAPAILQATGMGRNAFLMELAPRTMKRFMANCRSYDGNALNCVSFANLQAEDSASGFATGCKFAQYALDGIIANIHYEFFTLKRVRTPLLNVDLGEGIVTGDSAKRAMELIRAGVQLTGFTIA